MKESRPKFKDGIEGMWQPSSLKDLSHFSPSNSLWFGFDVQFNGVTDHPITNKILSFYV